MFDYKAFVYPKDPISGTVEDAWRVDPNKRLLVISDGASSSLFSGTWANLLCDGVVESVPNPTDHISYPQWLNQLRQKWAASIDYNTLAWYQRPKVSTGAFATLVWAEVEQTREVPADLDDDTPLDTPFYQVQGYAVGDACLLQFRRGKLLRAIPLEKSADFDSTPMLVGSANLNKDFTITYVPFEFVAAAGDWLVLATDAFAQWILKQVEKQENPIWEQVWGMSQEQFSQFIEYSRQEQAIRIDDTSLLLACLGGESYIQGSGEQESEAEVSKTKPAAAAINNDASASVTTAEPVSSPEPVLSSEPEPEADEYSFQVPTPPVTTPPVAPARSQSQPPAAHSAPSAATEDESDEYEIAMPDPAQAAAPSPKSQYLSMKERQVQEQIEREQRAKKEHEDSFGYQFQQGMQQGMEDIKENFGDMREIVGEQAKVALEKGKEQLEKGKQKIGQIWGKWFGGKKPDDQE